MKIPKDTNEITASDDFGNYPLPTKVALKSSKVFCVAYIGTKNQKERNFKFRYQSNLSIQMVKLTNYRKHKLLGHRT